MIFKNASPNGLICLLIGNRANASISEARRITRFVDGYSRTRIEEGGWKLIAPEGLLVWQE
jgi:hypothetical protein